MSKKSIAAFLLLAAVSAGAINLSLAQIDASRLLLAQEVDLYVSVTDGGGQAPGRPSGRGLPGLRVGGRPGLTARCGGSPPSSPRPAPPRGSPSCW